MALFDFLGGPASELSADLGIARVGADGVTRFLVDEHLIFPKHAACGDISYDFYAQFAHHFVAKETIVEHSWGTCSHYTLRITARGIELIRKRLAKVPVAS